MKLGKMWDDMVRIHVDKNSCFPVEFGSYPLAKPQTQVKIFTSYSDRFDLVGVFDVLDSPILYEIKAGAGKDSAEYANDYQVALYFLLCHLTNVPVDKAYIMRLHPYTMQLDRTLVYNTAYERNRARNFIDSIAPDIYSYFTENSYFDKPPHIDKISNL